MNRCRVVGIVAGVLMILCNQQAGGKSKFSWMKYDHYDEIDEQYRSVTADTCRSKNKEQLMMRSDVVSQLPFYNQLLSKVWYQNRTALIHVHNMALNRAFFYSYVLQKMNDSETFSKQPNWMYFYMSAAADVNSNPYMLNGSALYFDTHCHYPNWYTTIPFNKTIPLFGPKAYRWDDYQDQDNFLREPTRQVVQVVDYGAGHDRNYTNSRFKMNPWYLNWLPDIKGDMDSMTKFTYYIGIKASNVTGEFTRNSYVNYAFFGPSSPGADETDPRMLPVHFTRPYFDCGGSNRWVLSAVSPVIDFMPRYSNYTHLRRQRIVAVSVMDIDFINIDFNACGLSAGNPGPSYLAGTARCKSVALCKHKTGYGFKRGGYTCHCKPGRGYPVYQQQPYQGDDLDQATEEEYNTGFTCSSVDYRQVLPAIDNLSGVKIEGAGVMTSSGGLHTGLDNGRKRRQVLGQNITHDFVGMKSTRNAQKSDDFKAENVKPGGASLEEHTVEEYMQLAEKLRSMRTTHQFQKKTVPVDFRHSVEESPYFLNVDYEVERLYAKDVAEHNAYKKNILENKSMNLTAATQLLRDNIHRLRDRHVQRFQANKHDLSVSRRRRKRSLVFDEQAFDKMMRILRKKASVTAANCHQLPNHHLFLPGDVAYGVSEQFEPEGRTALRLSHFLSMYLQNVMTEENFGNLRGGGRLHMDQMFGEVIANVMGNFKIYSAGLFFDKYKFENQDGTHREFFGPWAFRKNGAYYVVDKAGLPYHYINEEWFQKMKSRFSANFSGVKLYKIRAYVRSDPNGTSSIRHEFYPMTYRAAPYELGSWTRPYFRCDGNVDSWVMTYVSPFFGLDSLRTKLEFRGVTTVDVPLNRLEINQCAQPFSVANAFKNTARCHYFSTRCVPQAGFAFLRGSYRCLCKDGFEYWHLDGKFWIEGSLLELEYEKKKLGLFSRFDLLTCRVSTASEVTSIWSLVIVLVVASISYLS